ncbi:MAG: hypothetical protein AAB969_03725, partial [Patescibacteria group bacterium]
FATLLCVLCRQKSPQNLILSCPFESLLSHESKLKHHQKGGVLVILIVYYFPSLIISSNRPLSISSSKTYGSWPSLAFF